MANPDLNQDCSNLKVGNTLCLGFINEDCWTTHVVGAGDTCQEIATANGLNMTILRLNNPQLDQDCNIYDGEVRLLLLFSHSYIIFFLWPFIFLAVDSGPLESDPKY